MKIVTLYSKASMHKYATQVWQVLADAYASVEGGLNYESLEDLMGSSAQWKVVLHNRRVAAVAVYRAKKGLKLVAFAACKNIKKLGCLGLVKIISADLKYCWMELSEHAERFVMQYCGGDKYIIGNSLVSHILDKPVELADSGYHYVRVINHVRKTKVLLGTVSF